MSHVEKLIPLFDNLDPIEREELMVALAQRIPSFHSLFRGTHYFGIPEYPSIVRTPGICGGVARLIRTRIPVWTLERMRQTGVPDADILRSFPALRAEDLVQASSFAERHRAEIEQSIRENEEE